MTAKPIATDDVRWLLPFRVNATLKGDEAELVENALRLDPDLQIEERILTALRAEMQNEPPVTSPGEFGLARLNRALDAEVAAERRWRPAAMAAAVAAVVTATATVFLTAPEPTAGDLYVEASGGSDSGDLVVAFRPAATQEQITALLLAQGLSITDGPSALGLYRLRSSDGEDPVRALAALQNAGAIVESAEIDQ